MCFRLFHAPAVLVLHKLCITHAHEIPERYLIDAMEIHLSFHFIVKVLNYETVLPIRILVRADIFI